MKLLSVSPRVHKVRLWLFFLACECSRDDGHNVNVAEQLERRARTLGRSHAPAYLVDARVYTHAHIHSLGARLASVLTERGIRPGDRVLVALADGVEFVAVFLALARLGAVAMLVNPQLPVDEHGAFLCRSRPVLTISGAELEERFVPAWLSIEALVADAERAPEAAAANVADRTPLYVQFTSGTTGTPKGAVHSHGDILLYHHAVGERMLRIGPLDVTLSISKMFFTYGFGNSFVYPLCSGSTAVLTRNRPAPAEIAELIRRHDVTVLHGVPSAYANLLAETTPDAYATVRVAVSAGEALLPGLGSRVGQLLGAPLLDELGSTEIGGAYCANLLDDNRPGTIGRPLHGYRVQVRDSEGRPAPDETEGRIWVTGPTVMAEYLHEPERTKAVLVNGWLSTSDTGIRLHDGRFAHTGRSDDIEIVGGINIAPREVEAVLLDHPAVRELVVAAVRDDRGASKLRAFVVTKDRSAGTPELERELLTLARGRLAAFKVPRSVAFVPALPRTASGKVRRFMVRSGSW